MAVDPGALYRAIESLGEEVGCYQTGFATEAQDAGVPTQLGSSSMELILESHPQVANSTIEQASRHPEKNRNESRRYSLAESCWLQFSTAYRSRPKPQR